MIYLTKCLAVAEQLFYYLNSVIMNISGIWLFDSYLILWKIKFKIKHCIFTFFK